MKLHKHSPGVALVIVLGFLVIISALAVAFFSSVTTELKASRNFAAGVTTRQLADSAVQTVMGQIRDATSRPSACWASQPGMIRTYRDSPTQPSANPDAFFKLYSSDNMVVVQNQLSGFDTQNYTQDFSTSWATSPAYFTDLNAPVMVTDPTSTAGAKIARYPIIDPGASGMIDGFSFSTSSVGTPNNSGLPMPVRWIYVLQDGSFSAPDHTGTGTTATFSGNNPPTATNPIVGRIAFWTDDETSKLNLNTAGGYTPKYPPSGYTTATYAGSFWDTPRFYTAFDMGTPGATGLPDSTKPSPGGLAICQLLQNEFQRYPGHPATTSLDPVLSSSTGVNNVITSDQQQLYTMLPRYTTLNMNSVPGSSAGGTNRVVVGTNIPNPTPDVLQLQPKQDRLFASVDELIFAPHSTMASNSYNYARQTNNTYLGVSTVNAAFLDKVRFFLTTQSSAPELNLYGQPRVSIWPVRYQTSAQGGSLSTNGLNAFDNTILFCSSVGQSTNTTPPNTESLPTTSLYPTSTGTVPYRYIFTRQELRPPGTSSTAADTLAATYYANTSYTGSSVNVQDINMQRNRQLITYLQNMTGGSTSGSVNSAIPGFGGSFLAKYGELNRDGILTEIFDYIRCANAIDTTSMSTTAFTNGTPTGSPVINAGNPAQFAPQGIIMPSRVTLTGAGVNGGMGRFPTIAEASLVFYYAGPRWADWVAGAGSTLAKSAVADFSNPQVLANSTPVTTPSLPKGTLYPTVRRYRAFLLFSTFNPMQGYAPTSNPLQNSPKVGFSVTGLDGLAMTTYNLSPSTNKLTVGAISAAPIFPSSKSAKPITYTNTAAQWSTKLLAASGATWGGRNYGGYEGFMHTLIGQNTYWAPHKIARGNVVNAETNAPTTTNYLQYPYTAFHTVNDAAGVNQNTGTLTYGTYQEFYELQSPDPDLYPTAELAVPVVIQEKTATLPRQDQSDAYFSISSVTSGSNGGGAAVPITVKVTYGSTTYGTPVNVIQTLTLNFPPTFPSAGVPTNLWPLPGGDPALAMTAGNANNPNPSYWQTAGWGAANSGNSSGAISPAFPGLNAYYWNDVGSFYPSWHQAGAAAPANTVLQTQLWSAWSLASRIAWSNQQSNSPFYNSSSTVLNYYGQRWRNIVQPGDVIRSLVYCNTPATVGTTNSGDMRLASVQSAVPAVAYNPHPEYYTTFNRACLLRMADGEQYFPQGGWPTVGTPIGPNPALTKYTVGGNSAQFFDTGLGNHVPITGTAPGGGPARFPPSAAFGNLPYSAFNGSTAAHGGVNGLCLYNAPTSLGDFDTGIGSNPDGPFGNKQDEGNVIYAYQDPYTGVWYYPIPYFAGTWQYAPPGNTYTSPCRQMPSPAMFGSLPSKPMTQNADGTLGQGWTTLCFCPNPAAGPGAAHPGNATPRDHLLLDLFQMPVVEPYPISEPFATAGKVNLNYKIAPFAYIQRSTALRGVLTPMRVTAIGPTPNGTSSTGSWSDYYLTYKSGNRNSSGALTYVQFTADFPSNPALIDQYEWPDPLQDYTIRTRVDLNATISAFDSFFAQGTTGSATTGFFRAASQICEMYLYPTGGGMTYGSENLWWAQKTLTGDNVREKPYVDLYNRITTKSNAYTVHLRVETLRQLPRGTTGSYANWNEGKDIILGEYRGSSTIERYIDPADRRFDPTNGVTQSKGDGVNPDIQSVETMYRFRTVITKKFTGQ